MKKILPGDFIMQGNISLYSKKMSQFKIHFSTHSNVYKCIFLFFIFSFHCPVSLIVSKNMYGYKKYS